MTFWEVLVRSRAISLKQTPLAGAFRRLGPTLCAAGTSGVATRAIAFLRGERLLLYVLLALSVCSAIAQDVSQYLSVSEPCAEVNQVALTYAAEGKYEQAEAALSVALTARAARSQPSCTGFVLHNMAVLLSISGRLAQAARFAERSIIVLEKQYSPDDPVLLRPLQILAATRFEQGQTTKARQALQRLQSIRIDRPEERALVHGMAGTLLHAAGQYHGAESAYLAAFNDWEEAGRGATATAAGILVSLGTLYIEERRLNEARRVLDRALSIFTAARDTVPIDRIKALTSRGVLYSRRGEWRKAEQDLSDALGTADRQASVDTVTLRAILVNYAQVLRKNKRGKEAGSITARLCALSGDPARDAVADVTELVKSKAPRAK